MQEGVEWGTEEWHYVIGSRVGVLLAVAPLLEVPGPRRIFLGTAR